MSGQSTFRGRLARRFTLAMAALLAAVFALGFLALRQLLYERLDGLLLRLASIEAAATSDTPDDKVHFHDQLFLAGGPSHEDIQSRYAQVWRTDGASVLRSANLGDQDLPLPTPVRNEVVRSGTPILHTLMLRGERFRAVVYPLGLVGPQHRLHLLQVATSTEETDAMLRRALWVLVALVLVGSAVGGWVAWWMAGLAVRPVLSIIQQAEALEATVTGHQLYAQTDSRELDRLVSVLNAMLGRIDAVLERQVRFLADAGHAIKTPLTVLRGDLDVALRQPRSTEEYHSLLTQTLSDLKDTSALAEDLIVLARLDGTPVLDPPPETDLTTVVAAVVNAHETGVTVGGGRLTLTIETDGPAAVRVEEQLLARALGNLIDNAIRYGRPSGNIAVVLYRNPTQQFVVTVEDDGPGIPSAEQSRLFERFYRGVHGRATAPGSGLGLAIAKAIAEGAGGDLQYTSAPTGGAIFTIELPSSTPRSPSN